MQKHLTVTQMKVLDFQILGKEKSVVWRYGIGEDHGRTEL